MQEVIQACQKIENDFKWIKRKTGEDYISHLYEVTRMYIDFFGEKISQKRIISALFHDSIEDLGKDEYKEIESNYGNEIAFFVHILSKESIDLWKSKDKRNEKYFWKYRSIPLLKRHIKKEAKRLWLSLTKNQIKKAAYMVAAIKVCDRIHNLMTMDIPPFSIKACKKKLNETEEYLVPLIHSIGNPILFDALRRAILHLTRQIQKAKVRNNVHTEA